MNRLKEVLVVTLLMANSALVCSQITQIKKMGIEEMFELAETNSRSLRVFDLAEKESEQAIKIAQNAKLPSIDVSLSASYLGDGWIADRDFSNGANAPMPHFGNNFAIEASQVLYSGGAITTGIEIAKLQQQLAHLDKEENRQDIRFLLVGNYLEMYKLRNQEEVYLKNMEQTKQLLSEIQARQKEGLALKNDITRYELQLKSLELALIQVRNSIFIFNNQLVTVLGLPEEVVIEVDSSLLAQIPSISNETDWQQEASHRSPVLQQSKLGITQSENYEKRARSERLPSIALFAANHFDGPITIEVPALNKNFNYWYAGVSVQFNLASLYTSEKNIKRAKFSTQRAVEHNLLLQENVQINVKATYIRFVESFAMYDMQTKSLELATQNYETVNKRYLNELALITDMLDASNSKLAAELQVANAQINILFNYYKLKKASGNL